MSKLSKICGKERLPQSVFSSTMKQTEIQRWVIDNVWSKYPLSFGQIPKPPFKDKDVKEGNWLLVTHFGDDPDLSTRMLIEAINTKSKECGTGITMILHDDVKENMRGACWHEKKPKVLSITEVTQEWVWISFSYFDSLNGITTKDTVSKLFREYPAGNEVLCALLMSDELISVVGDFDFPEVIMPGFLVKAAINGSPMDEYCLKVVSYKTSRLTSVVRVLLQPIGEVTKNGVILVCSQY